MIWVYEIYSFFFLKKIVEIEGVYLICLFKVFKIIRLVFGVVIYFIKYWMYILFLKFCGIERNSRGYYFKEVMVGVKIFIDLTIEIGVVREY